MMVFLPLGLIAVFVGMWFYRRGNTLSRECRWRAERHSGENHYRCAACGAECDPPRGREPRACLRPDRVAQQ